MESDECLRIHTRHCESSIGRAIAQSSELHEDWALVPKPEPNVPPRASVPKVKQGEPAYKASGGRNSKSGVRGVFWANSRPSSESSNIPPPSALGRLYSAS